MATTRTAVPSSPAAVFLAGTLSLAVAMGIGRFAFTPMLPLMVQAGQIDVPGDGWVAAANYAGYLLGALSAAALRWSAARLATVALLLTAGLAAAMAWPGSMAMWMVLRLLAGAASAWAFIATSVWCLGALARTGHASWSSGVYSGVGFGIAAAGAWCLAGAARGLPPATLWLQLGLLSALSALPALYVLFRMKRSDSELMVPVVASAAPASSIAPGTSNTLGLVICYGTLGFGYILPATFLPVLARSLVDDPRVFGLTWPAFGLTAAASTFVAAWWLRRASRLEVWAISHGVMGLGAVLPSLWLNGWTVGLSAFLVGGTFLIATLAGVQEIRSRAAGDPTRLVARMTTAFALGQIAGPVASSLLVYLPALATRALEVALQIAAATLWLTACWLTWQARQSRLMTSKEMLHVH